MEKAKLALEQKRINWQQFQQQRDYEFKCQLQEKQHEDENPGLKKFENRNADLMVKGNGNDKCKRCAAQKSGTFLTYH